MVLRRSFLSAAVSVLVLLGAVPLFAGDASDAERVCIIKGIIGDVKVRRNPVYNKVRRERARDGVRAVESADTDAEATKWRAARLNMVVKEKDEIMTGPQSEVRLETPEGSAVKLGENTTLEIATLQFGPEGGKRPAKLSDNRDGSTNTKVKVSEGSLVANVNKIVNSNSTFKFETPTATAAIRGTVVELEVKRAEAEPAKGAKSAKKPAKADKSAPPKGEAVTLIRVFDGTVLVAPTASPGAPIAEDRFVEVKHMEMVEFAPGQKAAIIKKVPKDYVRKTAEITRPAPPAPEPEPLVIKLTVDLGDDTVALYARDSVVVRGVVRPVTAKVSVNGAPVVPDSGGVFKLTLNAPSDSGVYPIRITAEEQDLAETVIRTMKVAHVYTAARLHSPVDGVVVSKPSVTVSGTASPGSRVNALGKSIEVKRNGTFEADVAIPDREGEIKLQVEIVDKDNDAVWIERSVHYYKSGILPAKEEVPAPTKTPPKKQ